MKRGSADDGAKHKRTVQRAEQQLRDVQVAASAADDPKLQSAVAALSASFVELKIVLDQLFKDKNELAGMPRQESKTKDSGGQLRALARRQLALHEQERAQLARELHDEFGAALTALKLDLHWLMARLPSGIKSLHDRAKTMSELIDRTVASVSRTGALLRPRVLDDFGLVAAIEWQTQDFQQRTGIECKMSLPEYIELDPKLSIAIFRIFQEALTNVSRHSGASEVRIDLRAHRTGVLLEVKDNGMGIRQEQISSETSFGMLGMRERASAFGGHVWFEGRSTGGTTVRVEIPTKSEEQQSPRS
jgi:signal transduction histidine kinase